MLIIFLWYLSILIIWHYGHLPVHKIIIVREILGVWSQWQNVPCLQQGSDFASPPAMCPAGAIAFNASCQRVSLLVVPNNSICLIIQHIKNVFSAGSHWAFSPRWRLWHLPKWDCMLLEWIPGSIPDSSSLFLSGFGANRIINRSWFVFCMAKKLQ